jgi:hypothetical protein
MVGTLRFAHPTVWIASRSLSSGGAEPVIGRAFARPGGADPLARNDTRRVGKGASAPCPPSLSCQVMVGTLRFAHPTVRIASPSLSSGAHSRDPLAPTRRLATTESVGWAKAHLRRAHHPCRARSWRARFALPTLRSGLLRRACHRARIRATRWLAMTINQ